MGNKTIARKIALAGGIPMAMGSEGNISNEEEAVMIAEKNWLSRNNKKPHQEAEGRGMRIVRKADEMEKMFYHRQQGGRNSPLNDPSVFIEKYIEKPKNTLNSRYLVTPKAM